MSHTASLLSAAKTIEVVQRDLPPTVPDNHVRLKLASASLCGTDLHYYRHFENAGFKMQRPVTLGHEACAFVVEPNGSQLAKGQLVALNPIVNCGKCEFCLGGQENLCTDKKFPGSATTVPHIDGFFQDEFDFPAANCYPAPAGTNPDHLTFAEPLACAMHSVTVSGATRGSTVLVTGCGPMGLLALVAAKSVGATVHVTDVRKEAIELALQVGATTAYLSGTDTLPTNHFDAVIEASGSPHAINQAFEAVKRQGRISILSNIQTTAVPINLGRIMLKEISVAGSFQFNKEFRQALDLIVSGKQDFDLLIAGRYAVENTAAALDYMLSGKAAGKILIKPEV